MRDRIQAADADITDDVLNELIADEQAFIEVYVGKTFAESDPEFSLARALDLHQKIDAQPRP